MPNVRMLGVPSEADEALWALGSLSEYVHAGEVSTVVWSVITKDGKVVSCVGKPKGVLWITVIGMLEDIKQYIFTACYGE